MSQAALAAARQQYDSASETPCSPKDAAQIRATLAVAAALIAIAERLEVK